MTAPYYSDEFVTLYHGDCREITEWLAADVLVTDPPYGVGFAGKSTKHTASTGSGYDALDDTPEYVAEVAVPVVRMAIDRMPAVVTPGIRSMFRYPEPRSVGTIYYPSGAGAGPWGFICNQPIFYYGKDPYLAAGMGSRPDSFSSTEASEPNGHPCPKPIGTMTWLVVRGSLEGQTVADPFAGSGTTLVAAKRLGRKAIGVELSESYCEIAAKRLAQGAFDFGAA